MKRVATALILTLVLTGCAAGRKAVYKVTFQNGDSEYYELDYRPKKNATSIEYEGETIIGVTDVELVK